MEEQKLFNKGTEESSKFYAIFENFLFVLLIVIGYIGMSPIKYKGIPYISIIFAIFVIIMLVFVLRKHLCTKCYYYDKCCHCGWGKLSSLLFKKDTGNQELGGKLAGLTWGVLMGLPILVMIIIVLIKKATLIEELIFFIPFLILVMINGFLHKIDCDKCKMRFICPGSASKKE
ncbi:MAG: hypothetical protein KAT68_16585 [Bacteroidales bacterium]|nr:hypothetical protein [Bacteroidales bacterium]